MEIHKPKMIRTSEYQRAYYQLTNCAQSAKLQKTTHMIRQPTERDAHVQGISLTFLKRDICLHKKKNQVVDMDDYMLDT